MQENPLDPLLLDGVIDEVLGRLKSGKEADIYLVRHAGRTVAAKVYKDRAQRSFKNNADYKEGRQVRSSRTRRAIETGSRFGRNAAEDAWKSAEATALQRLYASGVRVPEPIMFYEGVLLMELVLDEAGQAAPRLIDVALDPAGVRVIYADLRMQIVRMLCCELIHGDLSPYNILAAAAGPTIIDFPQVVSPSHSSRAEFFLERDFQNVLTYLAGSDSGLLEYGEDGRKIWRAYARRELTPEWVPTLPEPGWREREQREVERRAQARRDQERRDQERRASMGARANVPGQGHGHGGHGRTGGPGGQGGLGQRTGGPGGQGQRAGGHGGQGPRPGGPPPRQAHSPVHRESHPRGNAPPHGPPQANHVSQPPRTNAPPPRSAEGAPAPSGSRRRRRRRH